MSERRTFGPLAEMLLESGFPVERVAAIVRLFTRSLRPEMIDLIGATNLAAVEVASEQAIHRAGGDITYQVHVTTSTHEDLQAGRHATFEHLVEVVASGPCEAELIAAQMAACRDGDRMPTRTEVITDSTLTVL